MGIAAFSRVIITGLGLVIVGILTRTLGPDGFGQYNTVFAYLFIFTAIADMGLYTILVREVSKTGRQEESSTVSKIFSLRLVIVVAVLVIANTAILFFPYPAVVKLGILIASFFAIFSSLSQVLTGIFQKYLKTYFVSASDVTARALQLFLLLFLLKIKAGLILFIWVAVFSELVHFLLIFRFASAIAKIKFIVDVKYWKETMKIALPVAASLIFTLIYFKLDTVLISVMKPAYDVGIYSIAYKILEVVIFLPAIYIGLVMPRLSRYAVENKQDFIKTFRKAFDVLSIFVFHFCLYLFLMSGHIIKLVGGGGFIESGAVLKILSLAIFLIFFGNLGGYSIVASNLQRKGMFIYLAGAVFNIGANIILIPRYTYFAAAWTTVATEFLITFWMLRLIKKYAGTAPTNKVFIRSFSAAAVTVAVMLPFLGNFALATAVSLVYYPLLFLLKGFTVQDVKSVLAFRKNTST